MARPITKSVIAGGGSLARRGESADHEKWRAAGTTGLRLSCDAVDSGRIGSGPPANQSRGWAASRGRTRPTTVLSVAMRSSACARVGSAERRQRSGYRILHGYRAEPRGGPQPWRALRERGGRRPLLPPSSSSDWLAFAILRLPDAVAPTLDDTSPPIFRDALAPIFYRQLFLRLI